MCMDRTVNVQELVEVKRERVRSLGAEDAGGGEPPTVGVGNLGVPRRILHAPNG